MADEPVLTPPPEEPVAKVEGLEEFPEEIRPGIAAVQQFLKADAGNTDLIRKALGLPEPVIAPPAPEPAKPEPPKEEPVLKADGSLNEAALALVPANIRDQLVALHKAQAEAVEKAAVLEEERAVGEAIKNAAADYPNLPARAEDLGPALRKIQKAAGADAAYLLDLLTKANVALKVVVTPVGKADAGQDTGSKLEQLQARVRAAVTKGEFKSEALAMDAFLLKDKDLYAAIQAEKR